MPFLCLFRIRKLAANSEKHIIIVEHLITRSEEGKIYALGKIGRRIFLQPCVVRIQVASIMQSLCVLLVEWKVCTGKCVMQPLLVSFAECQEFQVALHVMRATIFYFRCMHPSKFFVSISPVGTYGMCVSPTFRIRAVNVSEIGRSRVLLGSGIQVRVVHTFLSLVTSKG